MIKAIIFDMVGPLLHKRPDYTPDDVVQTAEELSDIFLNTAEFVSELKKHKITKNLSTEEIAQHIVGKYCQVPKIWDELLPLLKQKYKLAVLNNGMSITIPYFKSGYPFKDYFEVFVNSAEANLAKPSPDIYHLVCNRLKVQPSECVFIDDSRINIEAAIKLQMVGILWRGYSSLLNNLKTSNIL